MPLKIGFAFDAQEEYTVGPDDLPDKYAELDYEDTVDQIEGAIKAAGHNVERIGGAKRIMGRLLGGERWDLVFNICEGLKYRNRESQVPAILEVFDIPYIGSDPLTMGITLDKVTSKKLAVYNNVRTPEFIDISSPEELENNRKWIEEHVPVIVKPTQEGTSKGLSKDSFCVNFDKVMARARWVIEKYEQPVLVEKFIEGYEFTVVVIGNNEPEAFPPVQIAIKEKKDLGRDFYTYGRVLSPDISYVCPADITAEFDRELRGAAVAAYRAVQCRDFGRIDFRVEYDMKPYFLECNPLPHLGLDDVFPKVAEAAGKKYGDMIAKIIETAAARLKIGC